MVEIERQVEASYDDCDIYWNGSAWIFAKAVYNQRVGYVWSNEFKIGGGMRFLNITIPPGAIIDTSYLILTANYSYWATTVNSKIRGEQSNDAATFSTRDEYLARERTTAVVPWEAIPGWTIYAVYNSPEIKTIIQELVDDYNGLSAANIVLFWDDHDGLSSAEEYVIRRAFSYDQDPDKAPKLHIEYTPPPVVGRSFGFIIG